MSITSPMRIPLGGTSRLRSAAVARRGLGTVALLPSFAVPAVALGGYLVAAAVLTELNAGRLVGGAVLVAVAALAGALTTLGRATAVGAFGWFFWSGFVVHHAGNLGLPGTGDALVVAALVGGAAAASLLTRASAGAGPATVRSDYEASGKS